VVGVPDRHTHKELADMSRPLAALASLVLAVLGVVVLIPDCASACSCGGFEGSQREVVERALSHPGAVFSGEVVEVDKGSQTSTVTLRVNEVWKGPQTETIQVSTRSLDAACGYPFKEGQEYLVYADEGKQGLQVNACGPTKPLSEAQADLEVLGNGETLGGSGVLSDTSGGFPPFGVMGMLVGAVAAVSLVVLLRVVRTS